MIQTQIWSHIVFPRLLDETAFPFNSMHHLPRRGHLTLPPGDDGVTLMCGPLQVSPSDSHDSTRFIQVEMPESRCHVAATRLGRSNLRVRREIFPVPARAPLQSPTRTRLSWHSDWRAASHAHFAVKVDPLHRRHCILFPKSLRLPILCSLPIRPLEHLCIA